MVTSLTLALAVEFVFDAKTYFTEIGKGKIIDDAPIFDYFYLQSFGPEEEWEWRLQDIHGFIGWEI